VRTAQLHSLLRTLSECAEGVTDLNFTPGKPPQVEKGGELSFPFVDPPLPELTPFMTEHLAMLLLEDRSALLRQLLDTGACDFSYSVPGVARFRVNVFRQRGSYSLVLRRLATRIPSIHDLVLPTAFREMTEIEQGLVLITGGPGTGKTTSMAALVHEMNLNRAIHIVTLEDPVEFLHQHQVGTVNQRELGLDFDTWANGMRAALRQAPRVIVVGELWDRETAELAICAAETGHLVISTMRTTNFAQTVQRLDDLFAGEGQERMRQRLADSLRWCVAQCLVPTDSGGRIAALEVVQASYRIQDLIRASNASEDAYRALVRAGRERGMQTADDHLVKLCRDGLIAVETARHYASDRPEITKLIDDIQLSRGVAAARESGEQAAPPAPGMDNLQMDYTFGRRRRG
jgi:twitching motility protein PilT